MEIIKEHRWIAPLLSVLIVGILGISAVVEIQHKQTGTATRQVNSRQWPAVDQRESRDRSRLTYGANSLGVPGHEIYNLQSSLPFFLSLQFQTDKPAQGAEAKQVAPSARSAEKETTSFVSNTETQSPPEKLFFTRTAMLTAANQAKATWSYNITAQEVLLLQRIVMAEAEGEPYKGKLAVANVVLNRLRSTNFPDTIREVIYQKFQFSPVGNGRINRVHPNEETVKAVHEALEGHKAVPDDTYYFLSLTLAKDLTVHHSRTKVATIGRHTFYK